jgi:DNA polymerase-3 subunit beta
MHLTAPVEDLGRILAIASEPVETKTTIPLLMHLRLDASEGRISALGTAWDRTAEAWCAAEVKTPGTVAVPCARFVEIIGGFDKKASATLSLDGDVLAVQSKKSMYRLRTLPPDELPIIPEPQNPVSFKVDAAMLAQAIATVDYAAFPDTGREYLNCIYVTPYDERLHVVACDGNRLALWEMKDPPGGGLKIPPSALPLPVSREILSACLASEGEVEVLATASSMALSFANARLIARLMNVEYPSYMRVVPVKTAPSFTVNRDDLLAVAERSLPVFTGLAKAIPTVRFRIEDGKLLVEAGSADLFQDEVEATLHTTEIAFALRVKYLIDALGIFPKGSTVDVQLGAHMQAILLTSEASPQMRHVIMPTAR